MDPAPLHLLCIEPQFPGRLGAVADWLVRRRGCRCHFFCNRADPQPFWPEAVGNGLEVVPFTVGGVAREPRVEWTRLLERGLCYAYGCWETLRDRGHAPVDLVLGRSARLGSTLFTSLQHAGVPVVNFFDAYLAPRTGDLADEDAPAAPPAYTFWRRSANVVDLLDLENGVHPWTPTTWQRDSYPAEYRGDFLVLFDGVDTRRFRRPARRPRVLAGRSIPPGTRVVSFVADSTDRLAGFDRFLGLMNRLVRAGEDVLGIVVGDPVVRDGLDVHFYQRDYRAHALVQDPPADPARLWFLDRVPPAVVADLLTLSDLHVHPNRPAPVPRSLLEAMAAGCVVLAAESAAIREVLEPNRTGLLVDPADPEAWEAQARAVLRDPAGHRPLAEEAVARARRDYAQDVTLPRLAEHFDRLRAQAGAHRAWLGEAPGR